MPFCRNCGNEISENQDVCLKCGKNLSNNRAQNTLGKDLADGVHNKYVAAVLAILLGGIGAHKFYLGQIGTGIIYLLFCWTGIPVIIGLIEGIIYLSMSDRAFAQKYK